MVGWWWHLVGHNLKLQPMPLVIKHPMFDMKMITVYKTHAHQTKKKKKKEA